MGVQDVDGEVGVGLGEFGEEFAFEACVDAVPEGEAVAFS